MCYKRKCDSQTNSYSSALENGLTLNFDNVQVNLNRLSQNELDYLCDKEGDESSDSDFEVTVDHVEPASSEVIKVKHSFEVGLLSLVLLPAIVAQHVAHPLVGGEVIGSNLGLTPL